MSGKGAGAPRTVIVVGAGIVGLSTAWFLQKYGVGVTVVERDTVASGSSWGNAGWISPGLAIPLNEPGVLGNGLKALFDPAAPLSVPPTTDTGLLYFLASFALNSRQSAWERALRGNVGLSSACLDAFEELSGSGVAAKVEPSPITALFSSRKHAARLLMELDTAREAGLPLTYTALEGEAARAGVPLASNAVRAGVRIDGQSHVNPGLYTHALADSVRERGASVVEKFRVTRVEARDGGFRLHSSHGETESADAVVVATGAWLGRQSRPWGVNVPLRAGRGYSFTVPTDRPVPGPVYLPEVRVACTPHGQGLRVAGTMEFRDIDAPFRTERVRAITGSAAPYLDGVDLNRRTDEWVGSRPVTSDGLPLVGPTDVPGLYVAGGHGMWGLTHGPVTGRLLARAVATGVLPPALRPMDPTR
jgi:D-amino-acid dehydrogenase